MLNIGPALTTPLGFMEKKEVGVVVPMPTLPPKLPPTVAKYADDVAVSAPPKNPVPLTRLLPCTANFDVGVVVPTPVLPADVAKSVVVVEVRAETVKVGYSVMPVVDQLPTP